MRLLLLAVLKSSAEEESEAEFLELLTDEGYLSGDSFQMTSASIQGCDHRLYV